jgi:hypothetical protein
MAKYLLVSFKTCPWVQRAAIVLREKNVDFEFRHIEPDNRPDWFLAISPHKCCASTIASRCSNRMPSPSIWTYGRSTEARANHERIRDGPHQTIAKLSEMLERKDQNFSLFYGELIRLVALLELRLPRPHEGRPRVFHASH